MGYEKSRKLEDEERRYQCVEKSVCADCMHEPYLRQLVLDNGSTGECDYCCESSDLKRVIRVDELMPYITAAFFREFDSPERAGVPRDDGTYLISTFDTNSALGLTGLECDYMLLDDIADAFLDDEWVLAPNGNWMNRQPHEELSSLWDEFVASIKHTTRFFFRERKASDDTISPDKILEDIHSLLVNAKLMRKIDPSTLYRCRIRRGTEQWEPNAKTLGPPPDNLASAGRMNPAGIAYLYTAREQATALAEIVGRPPFKVVVGRFRSTRALNIVDLTSLPPLPSAFDGAKVKERENLLFLHKFAEEISQPVGKDGAEHIDYVPSQVVCEYFAQVVKFDPNRERIDGVAYPSAVMPSGRNLVIFPTERGYFSEFDNVEFVDAENIIVSDWQILIDLLKE